jgi:hypothetical protein
VCGAAPSRTASSAPGAAPCLSRSIGIRLAAGPAVGRRRQTPKDTMMIIMERWTIVADFVTRMVVLSIHTICLLLVGAPHRGVDRSPDGEPSSSGEARLRCRAWQTTEPMPGKSPGAGQPHCRAWQTTEPMPGKSRRRLGKGEGCWSKSLRHAFVARQPW